MGEALALIIVVATGGATLAAFLALLPYLARRPVAHSARMMQQMPGRAFVIGLVNFLFFSVVAAVLLRIGEALSGLFGGLFALAALTILWLLSALVLVGMAGLVRLLCSRLWPAPEGDPQSTQPGKTAHPGPPGRMGWSALLLVAALLAPGAGWFLLAPPLLLVALGASIIGLLQWMQFGGKGR